MDSELKDLLTKLLAKLDGIEERLKVVESKAHDQVSPTTVYIQPPLNWPQQWPSHYQQTNNPPIPLYGQAIC